MQSAKLPISRKQVGAAILVVFYFVIFYPQILAAETSISVGSFNVHYISVRQPEKMNWERRRVPMADAVVELDADIIGFQEMETFAGRNIRTNNLQLEWLVQHSPEYTAAAVGDPQLFPWTQPIFYRTNQFEKSAQGFFYFSATPEQIYSRPWDASFPSFASWVELTEISSNRNFKVVNVHFDHSSKINRHGAANLVAEKIQPWIDVGESVIVLGDINALSWFESIDILREAGLTLAKSAGSTFHFNLGLDLFPAIDHVLYSGFDQVGETVRLKKRYEGVWPSDHYPIKVMLNFRSN